MGSGRSGEGGGSRIGREAIGFGEDDVDAEGSGSAAAMPSITGRPASAARATAEAPQRLLVDFDDAHRHCRRHVLARQNCPEVEAA